ncbi:60Kd inner membrane protein-domain-containing protein [Achaetomium macrosporum]|uniref:60Kd inner membrane protein-domain-containing protein n=1 Tax=Achaetomium macrosporum TaxID=79813 RepID=A0AAN7HFH1_9PEZI|nr:60Kd inner membrane protein-domain-containing protein [Achaetomium macrosporum]
MASDEPPNPMAESGVTIRSDSEQYSGHDELSVSPPQSSSPAVILYQPPTIWSILRGAAINLLLPFINGMMLGFGELFAHEAAFRLGWSNTRFGTTLRTNNGTALLGAPTARRVGGPFAFAVASQSALFSLRQARNASTQTAVPPAAAPVEASTLADVTATPVNLTGSDLLDIPEQIGFLKTLGLEYGWGPTSLMQTILESVYVYTGLPWWASIALVAVGIRLALFKPAMDAAENSQRYQELLKDPRYKAAMEQMKRTMVTGNHLAGAEARAKIGMMNREAGYSLWKNLVPMLQVPLGYGMFRLMGGMAALPVPSFETGGVLWFTDLTASDPFFILPILTGILITMGIRIPLPFMAPQQQKTMRMMSFAILPISTLVSLFLPAGTTFYFFTSSLLHFVQTWLMHQPWFRRLLGLKQLKQAADPGQPSWQAPRVVDLSAPRVTPATRPAAAPGSETMFASLKSTLKDAKETLNERTDRGAKERAQKAAREYEEKRALEEKEKLIARLQQKRLNDDRYE